MTLKKKSFYLLIAPTILFFTACDNQQQRVAPKAPPPLAVDVVTAEKRYTPLWIQFTGMTKAISDQEVRARVAGRLEKRFFEDGSHVNKGDKLFLIEQSQYKSDLDSATSKKVKDQAALALAKADVKRYKPLVKEGLAARSKLEQYEARRDGLYASIAADDAAIQNAKLQLSYTTITAPISGQIGARAVDVGNLVGYGDSTLLATIVQTDKIYAYFSPSEQEVQKIYKFRSRDNLPAYIEVRGQGKDIFKRKRLNGVVNFTNNTVDPLTSTVSMRATIDNRDKSVYPGTFVYVNVFVTDKFDFVMIPPQAVLEDQLGKFVYTVDANNSAVRTGVETIFSTRYYTGVRKGLKSGDRVIISGLVKTKAGRKLAPKDVTASEGVQSILKKNNLIPKELETEGNQSKMEEATQAIKAVESVEQNSTKSKEGTK